MFYFFIIYCLDTIFLDCKKNGFQKFIRKTDLYSKKDKNGTSYIENNKIVIGAYVRVFKMEGQYFNAALILNYIYLNWYFLKIENIKIYFIINYVYIYKHKCENINLNKIYTYHRGINLTKN